MILGILLAMLLGPLLNLLIDRLPSRLPLVALPSCPTCDELRPRRALLPLAGWLLARGRCENCGAMLRRRALVMELGLPIAGGLLWLHSGGSLLFPLHLLLVAYFAAIVVIDLEHRLVLNRMTVPGVLAAIAIAGVGLGPSLPTAVLGAIVGFLFLGLPAFLIPGLGMGDIKLAAVIGAVVGFPSVITALGIGILIGGLVAGLLLVTRRIGRSGTIAYAPYLVGGVALVFFGIVGHGSP